LPRKRSLLARVGAGAPAAQRLGMEKNSSVIVDALVRWLDKTL
jgi:hypothetical protein